MQWVLDRPEAIRPKFKDHNFWLQLRYRLDAGHSVKWNISSDTKVGKGDADGRTFFFQQSSIKTFPKLRRADSNDDGIGLVAEVLKGVVDEGIPAEFEQGTIQSSWLNDFFLQDSGRRYADQEGCN